jgi:hypothetical protein
MELIVFGLFIFFGVIFFFISAGSEKEGKDRATSQLIGGVAFFIVGIILMSAFPVNFPAYPTEGNELEKFFKFILLCEEGLGNVIVHYLGDGFVLVSCGFTGFGLAGTLKHPKKERGQK